MHRFRVLLAFSVVFALAGAWKAAAVPGPAEVRIRVVEAPSGKLMPARLTLIDQQGSLAEFSVQKQPWLAYRKGVLYTGTGEASISVPAGRYTLYANRGLEYGLGKRVLTLNGSSQSVELKLTREVDTRGYISSDTHIHTLTHSGHGDSTLEERMATIAGEGIELAIATDHNHHVDYAPVARATKTDSHFTPVIGNEVTTKIGHFNAFPIEPGARVPNFNLPDWGSLIKEIRATPGVRVVVLNHPSNNHSNFIPTDPKRFHAASGEALDDAPWTFDALEVVTSAAMQSDWMKPYRDWFALLNRGRSTVGLGSSDTHDVNRFILGQARTYVASTATDPSRIDIKEACDNILAGKVLVSMGLFAEAWVDEKHGMGELATGRGETMRVRVRIQGPRWISADRLELYANGQKLAERPIVSKANAVVKADLTLELPRPKHDIWLVAIASGPGVREHYWPIPRPYQPVRGDWDPRVIGSTSPIKIDGDGDGTYSSPADYARKAVEAHRADPRKLFDALAQYDEATAVQAASQCRWRKLDIASTPFRRAIDSGPEHVRHGFVAYQNMLPRLQ
jgi:hypothetical protein